MDSFHCCDNYVLFTIELISLLIPKHNVLLPPWISSARILSIPVVLLTSISRAGFESTVPVSQRDKKMNREAFHFCTLTTLIYGVIRWLGTDELIFRTNSYYFYTAYYSTTKYNVVTRTLKSCCLEKPETAFLNVLNDFQLRSFFEPCHSATIWMMRNFLHVPRCLLFRRML